jgi:D-beta-D-heptose 7-phosphate kinase/D-beta-D-heptose 1-phosphate adenosyltransferase
MGQVVSQDELILHIAARKRNGERVVFTNGCFDLLHPGHIRCLEQARALGDLLVVAINGDASVRQLKGDGRPLVPQEERAEILAALAAVDYVVTFDAPTPRELIARLLPDVLVKGGDWGPDEIVGREEVEAAGGRVVSVPLVPGYSTSGILEKISHSGRPSTKRSPRSSSSPGNS